MKNFGESASVEQETNAEVGIENQSESLEATETKVADTSTEAIASGDKLLNEAASGIKAEEVDDGPGLLEVARDKMSQVKDNIKTLANSTLGKLKRAVVGIKLEEMSDQELADDLNRKRERHDEAVAHSKMTRNDIIKKLEAGEKPEKADELLVKGSYNVRAQLKEERLAAKREADKRGLEVLTDQQKEDAIEAANESLLSDIEYARKRYYLQEHKVRTLSSRSASANNTALQEMLAHETKYLDEITRERDELIAQAEAKQLDIPDAQNAEKDAGAEINRAYRAEQAAYNQRFAEEQRLKREEEEKKRREEEFAIERKTRWADQFKDEHGVVQDEIGPSLGNTFDKDWERL